MTSAVSLSGPVRREVTLAEWADMDEDEPGELVDGVIEEEEVPSVLHELVVAWLVRVLGAWLAPRGGLALGSEHKVGVGPRRGRKPDVSAYLPGAPRPALRASLSLVPPSIVVEVLSPRLRDTRRDRVEKLGDYARFQARFYWLVDPEVRTLEVLELGADGRYAVALSASEGTHDAPGCPGLSLDLDGLWREIDALAGPGETRDDGAERSE